MRTGASPPGRNTSRSSITCSSRACSSRGSSPTSSRNSVPPFACTIRPTSSSASVFSGAAELSPWGTGEDVRRGATAGAGLRNSRAGRPAEELSARAVPRAGSCSSPTRRACRRGRSRHAWRGRRTPCRFRTPPEGGSALPETACAAPPGCCAPSWDRRNRAHRAGCVPDREAAAPRCAPAAACCPGHASTAAPARRRRTGRRGGHRRSARRGRISSGCGR